MFMNELLEKLFRISIIAGLGVKETIRKKLLFFLLISCIVFIATGAGCTNACMGMTDSGMEAQYIAKKEEIQSGNLPEKAEMLAQLEDQYRAVKKESGEKLTMVLSIVVFSITGFWLFLIAAIFTPFTVMNDFDQRMHVMILARPVSRTEFLVGKFSAILFVMLLNLVIMLAASGILTYLSVGETGFVILKGMLIFLQGLAVFTSMMLFFSLVIGRLPAVFLGFVLPWLTVIPAISIINGDMTSELTLTNIFTYVFAYGLPQYSINYFYSLSFVIQDIDFLNNMHKIGNNTGIYSLFINTVWFGIFWGISIFILNKKDIET